ncbi:MAG: DUF4402 domain-containing protein [Gemmatimonas sp.]|jgi:hypothetical protein|uniref:DUF4402 domain-containing protein n=1 Tax=Gemmatimonas sp. TaxID=1962908 RepID=UPI00391F9C0F|nr:DUF4402 domain-containing protein [Gemmatimonadota bacterium]
MQPITLRHAALAALLLGAAPLAAQAGPVQTVNVPVSARVFTPLTVTSTDNLRFGTLYAPSTTPKAVDFIDNAASGGRARVTIAGEGGAALNVVLTVPSELTSGGNSLSVGSFALRWNTNDADGAGTDVNLTAGSNTISLTMPGSNATTQNMYLRFRATASPTANQAAGSYTGQIGVSVNYTGA